MRDRAALRSPETTQPIPQSLGIGCQQATEIGYGDQATGAPDLFGTSVSAA